MKVILFQISQGETTSWNWLREGQTLSVGRSSWSDVCVGGDVEMAAKHFSLELGGSTCRLRTLAGPDYALLVNGVRVIDAVLRDHDMIQAGQTLFRVAIEMSPMAAAAHANEAAAAAKKLRISQRAGTFAFAMLLVGEGRSHWKAVWKSLAADRLPILVANFRRAGLPLPADLAVPDFFEDVPDVRNTDSLHLIPCADPNPHEGLIESLLGKDAAILVFAAADQPKLIETHRLYWAWFAQPSVLMQQIQSGSPRLAAHLLEGIDAAVFESGGDDLAVLVRPELADPVRNALDAMTA